MTTPLRFKARLNEIDRRLLGNRIRMAGVKWIGSPALAAFVVWLGYLIHDAGRGLTASVLGGLGGLTVGLAGVVGAYRGVRRETEELEDERRSLERDQEGGETPA